MSISLLRSAAVGLALVVCTAPSVALAAGREPARGTTAHRPPAHAVRPAVQPIAAPAPAAPARETVHLADSFFTGPLTGGVGFDHGAGAPPAPVLYNGRRYR